MLACLCRECCCADRASSVCGYPRPSLHPSRHTRARGHFQAERSAGWEPPSDTAMRRRHTHSHSQPATEPAAWLQQHTAGLERHALALEEVGDPSTSGRPADDGLLTRAALWWTASGSYGRTAAAYRDRRGAPEFSSWQRSPDARAAKPPGTDLSLLCCSGAGQAVHSLLEQLAPQVRARPCRPAHAR